MPPADENRSTRRKPFVIALIAIFGVLVTLIGHSRLVSDADTLVPILSEENLRGALKWLLYGAPFYLFLIFAPDRFFLDDDDDVE